LCRDSTGTLSDGGSTLLYDMIDAVMVRRLILPFAILCLFPSLPCVAQELAPVIRLSADEAKKAKQVAEDVDDAKDRRDKAKLAWTQFHQTYQAAHADLRGLRFSKDFRVAFALVEPSKAAEVRQVAAVELTPEERKKLEALHQEMIDSEQSLMQAERAWREFQYQLVVDHVGTSTEGAVETLGGKRTIIPNPWGGGLAFTSDFRLAFPL
jgi:hypothetical protein